MVEQILKKYHSENQLKNMQKKLLERQKYFRFGNKISVATKKIYENIEDILNNENNFIECEICQEKYSPVEVIENFEDNLNVCIKCQREKYDYCESCQKPIYYEDYNRHIIDYAIYCNSCFFDIKENILNTWIIKDKKLKALDRLLRIKKFRVNYENLENYKFKIGNYYFSIEKHSSFLRLGSWSANLWIDLCQNENNLLKAIDWSIKYYGAVANIQDIKINN